MKIEHANITVQSIAKTQQFLQTAFPDFRLRGKGQLQSQTGRWAHIGNDETYISIQETDPHRPTKRTAYLDDGLNHLGFIVENLDTINQRLEAKGYIHSSDPENSKYRRRSYYTDENGIEWEFVQYNSQDPKLRNHY